MKINNTIPFYLILTVLSSCGDYFLTKNNWADISVNKKIITESKRAIINTTVDKYSVSRKWFYGTIEITNKSLDTLNFNFNQSLRIDNEVLQANYNIYPISYALDMFYILPNSQRTWTVVWKNEKPINNYENITIQTDTNLVTKQKPMIYQDKK